MPFIQRRILNFMCAVIWLAVSTQKLSPIIFSQPKVAAKNSNLLNRSNLRQIWSCNNILCLKEVHINAKSLHILFTKPDLMFIVFFLSVPTLRTRTASKSGPVRAPSMSEDYWGDFGEQKWETPIELMINWTSLCGQMRVNIARPLKRYLPP